MKKKIVNFDDSKIIRNIINKELSEDYEIISFENAEEGLTKLDKIIPDLIIMDVEMPGMDGIAAVEEIKKNKFLEHIPVIMLTNRKDQKLIFTAYAAGADDYLLKDLTVKEIKNKVKALLEK
jgi:two-component system, OmpR family, alkaline phosphatase synthesis response regulator PhoP